MTTLNERQNKVLQHFKNGDNIFLTGSAGTGKTYLVKHIREICETNKMSIALTAMTGTAAYLIGGKTLHSWAGIGLGDKFLRHIERCKILLHLIDLSEDNLQENYLKIRKELSKYDGILGKKKEIIIFNKSDLLEKKDIDKRLKTFKNKIKKKFEVISVFKKNDLLKIKKILLKNVNK